MKPRCPGCNYLRGPLPVLCPLCRNRLFPQEQKILDRLLEKPHSLFRSSVFARLMESLARKVRARRREDFPRLVLKLKEEVRRL